MVNQYYDGRLPVEVTDMLDGLDARIAKENRVTGQMEMQVAVLRWAVLHRAELHTVMLEDSLIACMSACLAQTKAERPSVKREETA